jgi:putative oxidoreductase
MGRRRTSGHDGGIVMSRYYIPALGNLYASLDRYMLPMLRVVLGAVLIPHGFQKLFGWFGGPGFARISASFDNIGYKPGAFWVVVVCLTEIVGGLMLIFGLFTRFAALAVTIFMINSVWFTQSTKGFFWLAGGSEYSIVLLAVALVFLVKGGGEYSIDRRMSKEL